MNSTASEKSPQPVTGGERILSLDVLRGFAVLGILVMNVQSFSMIGAAYLNPTAYGDLSGANYFVWLLSHLFADSKLMAIFSMLFGAGIVLVADRCEATGRSPGWLNARRMLWLLVFGSLHGFFLWYGDILSAYAKCGFVVFWLRNLRPRTLIITGLLVVAVPSAISLFWQVTIPYWPEGVLEQTEQDWWRPDQAAIDEDREAYRGDWSSQQRRRVVTAWFMQVNHFLTEMMWRAGGLMLVGMGLYKLGVLGADRSQRFYRRMAMLGFGAGLPVVLAGVVFREAADWDIRTAFFGGSQFNYWASIAVALGWIALVMLFCRQGRGGRLSTSLAAAGRMALSCYLLETIMCTGIFYGHGLGLYGSLERWQQTGVVFGVCAVLLCVCPMWLARYRFGPFEWLWRSLTYMKPQPFRRDSAVLP